MERHAEHDEIMALIECETAAFLNRCIDTLCDCWVQDNYIQHTTILPYAGIMEVNGITDLRNHFLWHFDNHKPLDIANNSLARKDWQIVVRGSMAWVTFEQSGPSEGVSYMSGAQKHTRILEKKSGRWKLVSSTAVLSKLDFFDCPKLHVDDTRKILQASPDSLETVANHPVLTISAGRISAITQSETTRLENEIKAAQANIAAGNARMPVPLIFEERSQSKHSLCWIAILDMKIVILLDDDAKLVETTIRTAGRLFGLTAMQIRVAQEIAKGYELTSIASTLQVSTNTVRTHVARMFERVGVNNQKALLNRLLSAQAPTIGLHY